jgi:tetratricopeptide (TPR) repeat protein
MRPAGGPQPASSPARAARRAASAHELLERANALLEQGRYAGALAAAREALKLDAASAEARTIVEDAEAALLVESSIRKAQTALRSGARESALREIQAGLAVAPNDARLLALLKAARPD